MMYLYIAIALLVGLLLGKALFGKKAAPAPAPAPVAAVPAAPQEDEDEYRSRYRRHCRYDGLCAGTGTHPFPA